MTKPTNLVSLPAFTADQTEYLLDRLMPAKEVDMETVIGGPDLITRLEQATEGSRELDEAITLAVWPNIKKSGDKFYMDDILVYIDHHTTSLDAALTLIIAGDGFMLRYHETAVGMRATAAILGSEGRGDTWDATAHTPALAICIAALKARQ